MKNRYELIVVGGGFAGVAAAISAARRGVDTLLIERFNCLGGAAANGLVMPFMSYWTNDSVTGKRKFLCGGLFREIVSEMQALSGSENLMEFDEELLKLVLNRMCQKYGVNLLFNTSVTEARVNDGVISSIITVCKAGHYEFFADSFIDATGDAELSVLAGCGYKLGREKDGLCQPMTLCFRLGGVDKAKYAENKKKINELYIRFKAEGRIKNPRENVLIFGNFNGSVLHFNTTRIVKRDPTDPFDLTVAEIEAREQVFEMLAFLKENIEGFENARVLSTAMQIGIRESRKVIGEYTLTVEDLKSLARFEDAIATANYDIDIHNPEGEGTSHYYFKNDEWYEIPYRCLVPLGMKNLLVAGRCISATHEAQASFRIMPYCCEIGQAAGVAVSVARNRGTDLRGVDVGEIRQILRSDGFLI